MEETVFEPDQANWAAATWPTRAAGTQAAGPHIEQMRKGLPQTEWTIPPRSPLVAGDAADAGLREGAIVAASPAGTRTPK